MYITLTKLTFRANVILKEAVFGRYKSPAERMREHQRSLQKATRELDRERTKLESQEKQLIIDIKSNAKKGQMVGVHVLVPILYLSSSLITAS
jgi:charged multivesicular body protein 2A